MYISKINIYPSLSYRGKEVSLNSLEAHEKALAKQAKEELKMIKSQGKKAGTDAAWWRPGFNEAVEKLEKIARGEKTETVEHKNYESPFGDFYSYGDDGFI